MTHHVPHGSLLFPLLLTAFGMIQGPDICPTLFLVQLDDCKAIEITTGIPEGIPKGPHLGPILFFIYLNSHLLICTLWQSFRTNSILKRIPDSNYTWNGTSEGAHFAPILFFIYLNSYLLILFISVFLILSSHGVS